MKISLRSVAAVALLSAVAACGGSPSGTYQLDVDALVAAIPMPNGFADNPNSKEMLAMMKRSFTGTIELAADNTARLQMKILSLIDMDEPGSWALEGNQLTFAPGKKGQKSRTFTLRDGALSREEEQGGQKVMMTFRKK